MRMDETDLALWEHKVVGAEPGADRSLRIGGAV